jgi:small-conductance mechanosensitive channel
MAMSVPTSLLAGSGVAAFVIGFAMQDLLGNILAGFALYVSKPFKVGDLLQVDKYRARVLEVTWRSTRLVTSDRVLLEVPNGTLVKQPIINYHNPDSDPAFRITINLHYNVPPARAQAVLQSRRGRDGAGRVRRAAAAGSAQAIRRFVRSLRNQISHRITSRPAATS